MTIFSAILLAGGIGSRMGTETPKQLLPLDQEPIALYSFKALASSTCIAEIIVVCEEEYRPIFDTTAISVKFAQPGTRRQDSVFNGLQKVSMNAEYVCIHDSARPFISREQVEEVCHAAKETGAAVLGVPMKSTIKLTTPEGFVKETLDRSTLWEAQTPQVLKKAVLVEGFSQVETDITDDVSIAEQMGVPVKLVAGSYSNIKITTPEDLILARHYLSQSHAKI